MSRSLANDVKYSHGRPKRAKSGKGSFAKRLAAAATWMRISRRMRQVNI